jgi:hypothetical protein
MGIRRWATKNLAAGDLTALRQIADGRYPNDPKRVSRLQARRFVVECGDGRPIITLGGRIALLAKQFVLN